jgi:hypothetical protein
MAARGKTAPQRQATPAESVFDESPSEHIYIGSDDLAADPAKAGRTIAKALDLRNPIRHRRTELVLFEEGVLKVTEHRNGKAGRAFFLDLRFVDPIPTIERVVAKNWLLAAVGCVAVAVLAGFLMRFDFLYIGAIVALVLSVGAGAAALYGGLYRSYERTEFCTLHGRSTVLRFTSNLGVRRRFRAAVPVLSAAIEEAAERITADTAAYLRAEMREHYRLRGDGVLDNETCASGTGRILAQFDVQL